ncbi:MAG: ornithine carbamoyltransferase [Candidatus Micrarchaeota archaeon]|nr:ornithine carbamoyltransferase [Candidatus Micrarchaeota archaeon]
MNKAHKHATDLQDYSGKEIHELIELALDVKKHPEKYSEALKGKTLAMWFEKASLRTRVSFEAGMTQLGGHGIYLATSTTHMAKASLADEIKCLSRYADIICARTYSHDTIIEMAKHSTVPVINALSDKHHPCQALADCMTVLEKIPNPANATIAYVGDGNNVCNSLIIVAKKLGIKINVATPKEYKPSVEPDLWTTNPKEAVENAQVVYTDVWVSMGEEAQKAEKTAKLKPYRVNSELIGNRYFMHCLPAERGKEVTDNVIDSGNSIVFDQAENRLHVQKALMLKLMQIK